MVERPAAWVALTDRASPEEVAEALGMSIMDFQQYVLSRSEEFLRLSSAGSTRGKSVPVTDIGRLIIGIVIDVLQFLLAKK
jgi:hypothetical protein